MTVKATLQSWQHSFSGDYLGPPTLRFLSLQP